jgi:PBP1b-binding outer membrane lipoprotein LpoB
VKQIAKELNSDFALVGAVNDNKQRTNDGRVVVNYYQFDMQLINVETAEKVWIQTKEIKKVASR